MIEPSVVCSVAGLMYVRLVLAVFQVSPAPTYKSVKPPPHLTNRHCTLHHFVVVVVVVSGVDY